PGHPPLRPQRPAPRLARGHPRGGRPLSRRHRFPGYTPAQLAAIVAALAGEAGLCLTAEAQRKAAAVLAEAEKRHATGNARLAVRLLNQATTSQGRRITAAFGRLDQAALATICADDIPRQ